MSALDRVHRLNTRTTKTVILVVTVAYNACAAIVGAGLVFFAWWVPIHYGWEFDGWWRFLPLGLMGFGAFGVYQGLAGIIAATRSPPAPPPTTPDTW